MGDQESQDGLAALILLVPVGLLAFALVLLIIGLAG